MKIDDVYVTSQSGNKTLCMITKGCNLCVHWKCDITKQIPLNEWKDAYLVQIAEYTVSNQMSEELAFV